MKIISPRPRFSVVSVLLSLCACAVLSACGSGSTTTSSAGTSSSGGNSSHLTVAGVVFNPADPYWISMKCGAQSAAKQLGVSLNWQASPTPEVGPETTALNSVEVTSPNGILLAPDSPTAFVGPVRSLMTKGTPVVLTDSALSSNVGLQNVLTNHSQDGSLLAPVIAHAIGAHGTLAIVSDKAGAPGAEVRFQSLVALLHKNYPGIKVLSVQYDPDDSTATAAQIAQSMIRGNPGLSAIYAINGPMGIGVASGVQAAGATGKVKVFAFDSIPEEVTGVRSGAFTAIMGQSPYLEGATAVQGLVNYLRSHKGHDPVSPETPYVANTPVKLIDKANVNTPSISKFFYKPTC